MIALWNYRRFLPLFCYCLPVYDCTVKLPPFLTAFYYCLLVHDCTVKSPPFFTTFLLLFACVWLPVKLPAFLTAFHYCLLVNDCTVKSLPFWPLSPIVCLCVIALWNSNSLLSACVWLHCEIMAVFYHIFTIVCLCMIALWNHCVFDLFALLSACVRLHCEIIAVFWPIFHDCLLVYDCNVFLEISNSNRGCRSNTKSIICLLEKQAWWYFTGLPNLSH